MKFTFAIPTYNATVLTSQCLSSLRNFYPDVEVLVCDDGSNPAIQNLLKPICNKYNARLILNKYNYGFSYIVNRMLDQSTGDIVILCNNDIIFTHDILESTQRLFEENSKLGVMGYLLYYPNGRIQHGGYVRHNSTPITFGHWGHNESQNKMAFKSRYSIGVTGALMAIRKSMINEIGVYSPKYNLAYEDVEFCLRAWHCDWHIYYNADVSAIHTEGATRGANEIEKRQKQTSDREALSAKQYFEDIKKYNIKEIEHKVSLANNENKKVTVFKRMHALGDVIQTTGIIDRYRQLNPSDYIIMVTNHKYAYENNSNVDFITNKYDGNIDYDLDMAYELSPEKHRISAYSSVVFGNDNIYVPKLYNSKCNFKLDNNAKAIVIHPAVSWQSRTLPRNIWDAVIDYLIDDGFNVYVVGKKTDTPIYEREGVFLQYDKLSLEEIRQLIEMAGYYIGMDSGIMHIAQTTTAKCCLIFTVADPKKVLVRIKNTVIIEPDTCKFCLHDKIGETDLKCQHDTNQCIKEITSEKIIEGFRKLCV